MLDRAKKHIDVEDNIASELVALRPHLASDATQINGGGWRVADVLASCTVVELMEAQTLLIQAHIDACPGASPGAPIADLATAKRTAELVGMWFTRALAKQLDTFAPADLERIGDDPAAASKILADRDQRAHDAAHAKDEVLDTSAPEVDPEAPCPCGSGIPAEDCEGDTDPIPRD